MAKVAFPACCAVAVICGEHLISQVYPASVPVEAFLDSIVELLDNDLRRRGAKPLDLSSAYELQRANGSSLDIAKTLEELGVEDGTTLVLAPAGEGESFEPHYESLSTGLARVGKRLFAPVTAENAAHAALAVLGMTVATMVGLTIFSRLRYESSWITAAPALALGVVLVFCAFSVWRWWPARCDLLRGLGWPGIFSLAIGLAAAAPGRVGGGHVFIAALAVGVLSFALAAVTRRDVVIAAAVVSLCAIGTLLAATRMWQPVAAQRLGIPTLVGLVVLLTAAPTIALWSARIRPPHFGSITGRDLFRRNDGMPVDAVAPVDEHADEEPNLDATPHGTVIAEAAKRANGVLTGICVAAAISLPAAAWASLAPGQPGANAAAALAALLIAIFISRARSFTDRRQAVALVWGASAAACAGVVRYVVAAAPGPTPLLWASLVLTLFAGAGVGAALLVPSTRFTPLVRMAAEWLELAAIVVAMPLAAWLCGLFAWVRMR